MINKQDLVDFADIVRDIIEDNNTMTYDKMKEAITALLAAQAYPVETWECTLKDGTVTNKKVVLIV